MSLADDLATLDERPGKACWTGHLLAGLPDNDRDAVVAALLGTAHTSKIQSLLAQHGHYVPLSSLQRHRRALKGESNGCRCDVGAP